MNVKTYRAQDSEQAMRMIRAAHGPDAVILDCKSVVGGIELVVSWEAGNTLPFGEAAGPADHASGGYSAAPESGSGPRLAWSENAELHQLKQELASVKSLLTGELEQRHYQQLAARQPGQGHAQQLLSAMGVDSALAARLQEQLPDEGSDAVQREMIKVLLTRQLTVAAPPEQGAICLLGPQGAGKTTTIAKLAAQHVMRHGREDIALLTTDSGRVGAQEQLRAYGRILQVPVHSADSATEAARTLRVLRNKSRVFIDTAGLSFRDQQGLAELEKLVSAMSPDHCYLTLPADAEAYVQSEIIQAYSRFSPAAAVITRIDESLRLGTVLSNLIERNLPVVWCANGPKVPQNLSAGDGAKLVAMAMKMASSFAPAQRRRQGDAKPVQASRWQA